MQRGTSAWIYLGASLHISLVGCTDRTLDDDIEEVCRDGCSRAMRCDGAFADKALDQCISECTPITRQNRETCEAEFTLSKCISQLSCEESAEYEFVLAHIDGQLEFELSYPCATENIEYMTECLDLMKR